MTTVLNYEQWKEYVTNTTPGDHLIVCPECCGLGNAEHYCEECDSYNERTCDSCDGEGELHFSEIQEFKDLLFLHFSKEKYIEELNKDLTDLAAWLGEDRAEFLFKHGLELTIDDKRENLKLLH